MVVLACVAACSRKAALQAAARAAQERGEWAAALRDFNAAGDPDGAALAQAQLPVEQGAGLRGALDVAFTGEGRALSLFPDGVRDALTGARVEGANAGTFLHPPASAGTDLPPALLGKALLAQRTVDGALELRDPVRGKLLLRREGVGAPFAVSPDARAVAWQDAAGLHLAAVDARDDTLLDTAQGAARLAWSGDGSLLASCGEELRIYDAVERRLAQRLAGASGPCALSADGHAALAGGRLFALPILPPHPHSSAGLLGAAFARGELVTFGKGGKVATFDAASGEEHANAWVADKSPCGSSGLAVAAGRIAAGGAVRKPGGAGFEKLAQVAAGGASPAPGRGSATALAAVTGRIAATALAADAVVISAWPATLAAFDARTAAPRWTLPAFACTLASNGVLVAAGGLDGSLSLLEATTGARRAPLRPLHGAVRALAFSPSGDALVAAADEPLIVLYSVDDTKATTLKTETPIRALAFSRDGALLAAGGEDGKVYLLDLRTLALRATLPALRGPVSAVALSPDGEWLASGTAAFGGARLTRLPSPLPPATASPAR
jgi:hypothetical protein